MSAFVSKKYSYRQGYPYKVPAKVLGEVLDSIEEDGEEITSESLLDRSRPVDSPTHKIFEWDNTVAAEKYRLQQATAAINALQVEIELIPTENEVAEVEIHHASSEDVPAQNPYKYRNAFVNVAEKAPKRTAVFKPIVNVLNDDDLRQIVLKNALRELRSFEDKWGAYQEMTAVFEAIHKFAVSIGEEYIA